jgi:hypothetical protein
MLPPARVRAISTVAEHGTFAAAEEHSRAPQGVPGASSGRPVDATGR